MTCAHTRHQQISAFFLTFLHMRFCLQVYALGNPFGLDQTLTSGIISGLGRQINAGPSQPGMGTVPISNVIQTVRAAGLQAVWSGHWHGLLKVFKALHAQTETVQGFLQTLTFACSHIIWSGHWHGLRKVFQALHAQTLTSARSHIA